MNEKQTDIQKDQYSQNMVHTYSTVCQKDIQTDRHDRQKRMTNRPTNIQTDSTVYE